MKFRVMLAVVLLGASLSACSEPIDKTAPPAPVPSPTQASATPEPPDVVIEQGTYTHPFPKGTPVGNEKVSILIGDVTWDADGVVAAENQFNDPADPGSHYAMVPVTVQNLSDPDPVTMWMDVRIKFVAADGRSFDSYPTVVPSNIMDVGDLYAGGSGSGNLAFMLPADVAGSGSFSVSYAFSPEVFVSAV